MNQVIFGVSIAVLAVVPVIRILRTAKLRRFVLAPVLAGICGAAFAQDGLQLNVPYVCPDGSTYVVHSCSAGAKGEFCTYQRDQNSERYNRRQDVANQMKTCRAGTALSGNSSAKEHQGAAPMQQRTNGTGRAAAGSGSGVMFAGASMGNDPQIRRCLELGGTLDECMNGSLNDMGKAAEIAVARLVGTDVNAGKPRNGVVLVGVFRNRAESPELELTPDGRAVLRKCGTLADQSAAYSIRKSEATTQITVANEPAPIALTLHPDGSLSGPGSVPVKGSVIAGYQNQANCPVGTAIANCRTTTMPVYAPSTQRCAIGQLTPQAPPTAAAKPAGLAGMLSDVISQGTNTPVTYGLRLVGTYASSGGMKLEFENRSVTLDCGKAHVNAQYTVENSPGGFVVHVQNSGGPFQVAVAPDHTLRGSGSTTVNGRLVSSFHDESVSFTPHSESCAVGVFSPVGPSDASVPVAARR